MWANDAVDAQPSRSHHPRRKAARRGRLLLCGIVAAAVAGTTVVAPAAANPAADNASAAAAEAVPATQLFGWGRNDAGQLAQPATLQIAVPKPISLPGDVAPVRVEADANATFALGSDGHLYAWGQNSFGQLGDGTFTSRTTPAQVDIPGTVTDFGTNGDGIEYAVTSDGTLYQWGFGYFQTDGTLSFIPTPQAMRLPGGVDAVSVSPGFPLNVALGADHKIYSWHASPADAETSPEVPTQIPMPGNVAVTDVEAFGNGGDAGGETFLALGADGQVYTWGRYSGGALNPTPTAVPLPGGAAAVAISNGYNHFLAQDSTGQLYGWGENLYWQLGDGTSTARPQPIPINLPGGVRVRSFSTGFLHTLAIGDDGRVYGWGSGSAAALQDPADNGSPVPILQDLPNAAPPIRVEAGSNDTSFAIVSNIPYPPRFTDAAPPRTTQPGTGYRYTFHAVGDPAPQYSLSADAPSWLHLDTTTGVLSGTVPADATHATFSVTATNTEGSATVGPYDLISGTPVSVTGTTVDSDGTPIAGARVDGCSRSTCTSTRSAADGTFTLPWYAGTTIAVTAYPPQNLRSRLATAALPAQLVSDGGLVLGAVSFPVQSGAAPITDAVGSSGGLPAVYFAQPFHAQIDGCPGGVGVVSIIGQSMLDEQYVADTFIAEEDPDRPGHYVASIPALSALHGYAQMRTSILCPSDVPLPAAAAPAGQVPNGTTRIAGAVTAKNAVASSATLAAIDPYKIAEVIYKYGPRVVQFKDRLDIVKTIAEILANPSTDCQLGADAIKALANVALAPAAAALAKLSTPLLMQLVVGLLALNPVAAIAAFAVVQVVWPVVVAWLVEKMVDAAVDAAFLNKCKEKIKPNMLIDPSGTILDQHGSPVIGAVVTLLRSDSVSGPFTAMDTSDGGIEPATNPETTGADGVFHWDVRAGYYVVQAIAPGCHAPGDTTRAAVTLGPLPVPPPQVGLHLTLDCPDAPAPDAPTVTALDIPLGPPGGGTPVTLTGTGFTPNMTVTFGRTPAASVQFLSPTAAHVVAPAGSGPVDVRVVTDGGASATRPAGVFTYAAPPHVVSVSPSSGPLAGGTAVVVHGSGFTDASVVAVGGLPASSFTVVSDTEINAVTPPGGAAGEVEVQVGNAAGAGTDVGQFSYEPGTTEPASLTLSPATITVAAGHSQTYTAHGIAGDGTNLGDHTAATTFTIAPAAGSTGSTDGAGCTISPVSCTALRPGTYTVTGTEATSSGNAVGTATLVVTPDVPASVTVTGGDAQSTAPSQPFPAPLSVTVADQYGNPAPGVTVTFAVVSGSASFSAAATEPILTDSRGNAAATLTAGTAAGPVSVTATVAGLPAAGFVELVQATGPARADLSIKLAAPSSVARNGTGTVMVTVANAGPQAATPVYAAVRIPSGLTVTSSNPPAQRFGNTWLFRAATLASGKQVTLTLTVRNRTSKKETVSLVAAALSPVRDPNSGNNTATTSIRLH